MKRRATIALSVLTLVGCENMGLDYAGTGEEGRNRAPSELVSAVHRHAPAATQPVIVDGRRWVPSGKPITLDAAGLRSVGSSAGQTVYARHWDDAPFDMLFIRSQDRETSAQQEGITRPSAAEGRTDAEGQQASGDALWQPLVPVIGEDGGPPAQKGHAAQEGHAAQDEQAAH